MSDGKRFWGKGSYFSTNSFNAETGVTTRERGDILNCLPARDIFVQVDPLEFRRKMKERAAAFCAIVDDDRGTAINNHPIFYSEIDIKTIHNPSARVRKPWDHDFQG